MMIKTLWHTSCRVNMQESTFHYRTLLIITSPEISHNVVQSPSICDMVTRLLQIWTDMADLNLLYHKWIVCTTQCTVLWQWLLSVYHSITLTSFPNNFLSRRNTFQSHKANGLFVNGHTLLYIHTCIHFLHRFVPISQLLLTQQPKYKASAH